MYINYFFSKKSADKINGYVCSFKISDEFFSSFGVLIREEDGVVISRCFSFDLNEFNVNRYIVNHAPQDYNNI